MKSNFLTSLLLTCAFGLCLSGPKLAAQDMAADPAMAEFEQALTEASEANSDARRLPPDSNNPPNSAAPIAPPSSSQHTHTLTLHDITLLHPYQGLTSI